MKKLVEERIKNNLSYDDMARTIGISKPYYWQIEHRQRRLYYHIAVKIARIFNMKPDELFYDEFKED